MEHFLSKKFSDLPDSKLYPKDKRPFLDRIETIVRSKNSTTGRQTGLERLKRKYIEASAITKPESNEFKTINENRQLQSAHDALVKKLANGLFASEKQLHINEGHGATLPDTLSVELEEKYKGVIEQRLEAQRKSLEYIVTYVLDNPDNRPLWFRYFILRSVAKMGVFDVDNKTYLGRTNETIAPFIHLNHEAVGFVQTYIEKEFALQANLRRDDSTSIEISNREKKEHSSLTFKQRNGESLTSEETVRYDELQQKFASLRLAAKKKKEERIETHIEWLTASNLNPQDEDTFKRFDDALQKLSFADLYAFALTEVFSQAEYVTADGQWTMFEQGSNPELLEETLENKGTGWCTATGSASEQLEAGDFYVYYSYTKEEILQRDAGEDVPPTIPAIAIRMLNGQVYEVRGTLPDQNLVPMFLDIAEKKFLTLPGGNRFKKKAADMKHLTTIKQKTESNQPLTHDDLIFIHQLFIPIEGFGDETDPRIEEVLANRNRISDLKSIFPHHGDAAQGSWPDDTELLIGALAIKVETVLPLNLRYIESRKITVKPGVTSEVAHKLFDGGQGWSVVRYLQNFTSLSSSIAYKLFDGGQGEAVARHLKNFTGLDHEDFANELIDAGQHEILARHLQNFTGLSSTIAHELFYYAGQGLAVAQALKNFTAISSPLAYKLIDAGQGQAVVDYLKNFTGLSFDVGRILIEHGYRSAIQGNLLNFTDDARSKLDTL